MAIVIHRQPLGHAVTVQTAGAEKMRVMLPTLHPDQDAAFHAVQDWRVNIPGYVGDNGVGGQEWAQNAGGRFKVVRCGRRWGKTDLGKSWGAQGALQGEPVGWFAPDYKTMAEVYEEVVDMLKPVLFRSSSTKGVIRLKTGGRIDFWSLENERAGRSRKYKRVVIDEAGFTKDNAIDIWKRSIKPTLLDMRGDCLVASNTKGVIPTNFLYKICNEPEHGFIEYHAPSWRNPYLPNREPGETKEQWWLAWQEYWRDLRARENPLVFKQEYGAEFVNWSGDAFFSLDQLLLDKMPVPFPTKTDAVFAVIDTAVKTGSKNDGTAVTYWARNRYAGKPNSLVPPLVLLDWDIVQVSGDLLVDWLPGVFQRLEQLARETGARKGSLGAWIEDKQTGMILNQAAARRRWPARPIDNQLTSVGKDERAIAVSGAVYRGEVKMSQPAYDKIAVYKGQSANHFIVQVCGYRIGVKDQADDLLDTFCYGCSIGLGGRDGI
jgi:hypothetical protein